MTSGLFKNGSDAQVNLKLELNPNSFVEQTILQLTYIQRLHTVTEMARSLEVTFINGQPELDNKCLEVQPAPLFKYLILKWKSQTQGTFLVRLL